MGAKLSTDSNQSNVIVNVRGEKGSYFVGVLKGYKTVKSQFKNDRGEDRMYDVYDFAVKETNMETQIKQDGKYVPKDVEEDEMVAIFAPTRLNNALQRATVETTLKITYLGLGKASKKGGKPHTYDVEIV